MFKAADWEADVPRFDQYDSQYCAVTTLRMLLVMEKEEAEAAMLVEEKEVEKEVRKEAMRVDGLTKQLMDHNLERQAEQADMWALEEEFIVKFIHGQLGLEERFSSEQVHRASGVLMTNTTSLTLPEVGFGRATALYPVFSMMNHSCASNTKTLMNREDLSQEVIAQVSIKNGEEVTNCYTRTSLAPTIRRRQLLRSKWFFDCVCKRCQDPSELGSNLSSLQCQRARCGGTVLPVNPVDSLADWHCTDCESKLSHDEAIASVAAAEALIEERLPGESLVDHHERTIHALSPVLHPDNWLMVQLKQELGLLYGTAGGPLQWSNLSRPAKERKLQVCQQVVEVLGKVEKGCSPLTTRMVGELTKARVMLAKEDAAGGRLSMEQLQKIGMRAKFRMMHLAYTNQQQAGLARTGKRE